MIGRVYIATLPNGFFGSSGASWRSLSVEKISQGLKQGGYRVDETTIDKVLDLDLRAEDIVFYTSSDDEIIRSYVKDHVYLISRFCHVAPSLDALMAHENKGFQQLYRKVKRFGDLDGTYFFHLDEAPDDYPYVYKTVTGAGSSGVELIKNIGDEKKIKNNFRISLRRFLALVARYFKLNASEFRIYHYRHKGKSLSVAQNFIPGLLGDYKVLVFGEKYFVLERRIAKGSFKASGSGNFVIPSSLEELPEGLCSYARRIYHLLDVPYASLDVAVSDDGFHLIEYQATNFGPYTLVSSKGYFCEGESGWIFNEGKSDLEECFSEALLYYVERKKDDL